MQKQTFKFHQQLPPKEAEGAMKWHFNVLLSSSWLMLYSWWSFQKLH